MRAPHTARSARDGVARSDSDAANDGRCAECAGDRDQVPDPVRVLHQLLEPYARMRDRRDQESGRDGERAAGEHGHALPVESRKDTEDDREGQHALPTIGAHAGFRTPAVRVKTIQGDGWRAAVPDGLIANDHKAYGY